MNAMTLARAPLSRRGFLQALAAVAVAPLALIQREFAVPPVAPPRAIFSFMRLAREPQMTLAYLCSQGAEEAGLSVRMVGTYSMLEDRIITRMDAMVGIPALTPLDGEDVCYSAALELKPGEQVSVMLDNPSLPDQPPVGC